MIIKKRGIYYVEGEDAKVEEIEIRDFIRDKTRHKQLLLSILSKEIVELIMETIKPPTEGYHKDISW